MKVWSDGDGCDEGKDGGRDGGGDEMEMSAFHEDGDGGEVGDLKREDTLVELSHDGCSRWEADEEDVFGSGRATIIPVLHLSHCDDDHLHSWPGFVRRNVAWGSGETSIIFQPRFCRAKSVR